MRPATRTALTLPFLALLAAGLLLRSGEGAPAAPSGGEPGTFPASWIAGLDCEHDEPVQIHAYNEDFYILRLSKCVQYEAPFFYLIFGSERALLLDTGSAPNAPIQESVYRVIDHWLALNGRSSIPLVVAHSHGHFDHHQADAQFASLPEVTVVGLSQQEVIDFWGFQDYPHDMPSFDLGDRVIDVIGTPGHEPTSITLYDRRTELLLTGDIVYPGHLFIFSNAGWNQFRQSLRRLVDFARANPVSWVLGCHIEMSADPGRPFQYGDTAHPNEHVLQFPPSILRDILRAREYLGDTPQCEVFDEFVIQPVFVCGFPFPF